MQNNKEKQIILGVSLIPNFGFRRINFLFEKFGDWEKIWNLNYNDLKNIGLGQNLTNIFLQEKEKIDIEKEIAKYDKENIEIITYFDENYPYLLKQTYSPPIILFAKGNLNLLNNKNFLSVIGSRKFSNYGKYIVEKIIAPISQSNITIVSGLAIGIDSLSHKEALKGIGSTIAVLGSSISDIYPRCNFELARQIEKNGLLISEFPIGSKLAKENFPRRNRIIAGLSQATLVIEASMKSGALITANYALEENRELFSIPGSIFEKNCEGANYLIKQGAKLINDIDDILELYKINKNNEKLEAKVVIFETNEQKIIYNILQDGPCHIDKIVEFSRLNVNVVIASLTKMELSNIIANIGNQTYQINLPN